MLRDTTIYVTFSELSALAGRPAVFDEAALIERLGQLSAADCMAMIADLSTRMAVAQNPADRDLQRQLAKRIGGESWLTEVLHALLDRAHPTVAFCEQQLVHLARLVILHADSRPGDDFADGKLYERWVDCLFGVGDLLDRDLKVGSDSDVLSWELRQCGINHHEDQLPVVALHYEIYRQILPELDPKGAAALELAFKDHTGMSMSDFFIVGSAAQARFFGGAIHNHSPALAPEKYFSSVRIDGRRWGPFFELAARDQVGLAESLREEVGIYGPTTYGSLTFERFPLFEGIPGVYLPISMNSLQRRITGGVAHILAEAAEVRGRDRRLWTSKFGMPFQKSVEETLRRGVEASGQEVPIAADVEYTPSAGESRRSTDVMLGYEGNPIFIEIVSGPLRAATLTRGSREDFDKDLDRLVISKSKQLNLSICDFLDGELVLDGFSRETTRQVWPVIVTSEAFPCRDAVNREVEARLGEAGYLQRDRIGPLSMISAEELFFCEGFMERGDTLLALIRGWKSSPGASHSFKNFLVAHGRGEAPGGAHFEMRFAEAAADQHRVLFGNEIAAEEILAGRE